MIRFNPRGLQTAILILFINISCTHPEVLLLPPPSTQENARGSFEFTPHTVISVEDEAQWEVADWFAWLFASPAGFVPKVFVDAENPDVIISTDASLPAEAYRIKVTSHRITIEASSPNGLFYAFQTLRFALPSEISRKDYVGSRTWSVPAMKIEDVPGYSHRCLKLDLTGSHVPTDRIMEFIDCMAMLKLNNLHLVMSPDDRYTQEDYDMIIDFASASHVSVTPASACCNGLYVFPDAVASELFPEVAALAHIAWTGNELADVMHFNQSMDRFEEHLRYKGLYDPDIIYKVAVAELK
jgi:hypothetical protein